MYHEIQPKINESFATSTKVTELHPFQTEDTVQGALEILYKTDLFLREISGLSRFVFQPGGGSHGAFTIASMIRAYHELRGESGKRDEIITTIFSHPSNAAAAAVNGFKVITLYPDKDGYPDVDALKKAVSDRTAGLMITNPEDHGLFNSKIAEFTRIVHEAGGLCSYDQANANGILGMTRALEGGFDFCFFNLHKTFRLPMDVGSGCRGCWRKEELSSIYRFPWLTSMGKVFLELRALRTLSERCGCLRSPSRW